MLGPADSALLVRTILYEPLLTWDREFTETIPNIAQSFDVDDDGHEFTFHLRPGVRWSDGESFTAYDIEVAYNDIFGNEELYPEVPDWLTAGEQPATVEVIDDATVRFSFAAPTVRRISLP